MGFVVCVHCTKTDRFLCFINMHEFCIKEFSEKDDIPEKYLENKHKYRLETDPRTGVWLVYERDFKQQSLSFLYGDVETDKFDVDVDAEELIFDTILVEFYNKFQFKLQDFEIKSRKIIFDFFKSYSLVYYQVEEEIPAGRNNTIWMSIKNLNNFLSFLPKSRSFHWSLFKSLEAIKVIS